LCVFPIDTALFLKKDIRMNSLFINNLPNPFRMIWKFIFSLPIFWSVAFAQEAPKSAFNLISVIPHPIRLKLSLDTNLICSGEGDVPTGFMTGLMPWRPEKASLKAEAEGYQTAELKPFLKVTEAPLILLQESSPKILQFSIIPNSKERSASFYDAINLTTKASLEIRANEKTYSLAKNKRIRLTNEKKLSFSHSGGPKKDLDPSDPGNFLLVFYTQQDGAVDCAVIPDNPL